MTITRIFKESNLKSRKLIVDYIKELTACGLIEKTIKEKQTCWKINEEGKGILKKHK